MSDATAGLENGGRSASISHVIAALLGVALFSVVISGLYYNFGFEWGDIGSYAQNAYEITRGAAPTDFGAYGASWYIFGALVFQLTGVSWNAALLTLHGFILLVACCLYLAVYLATRRVWPAVAVAVIFILVPPFTASVIRSVAFALNLVTFMYLASAKPSEQKRALLLASISVGITFQLRPDYGYVFLPILWGMLGLRCWYDNATIASRVAGCVRAVIVSTLIVAATMMPLFVHAYFNGYVLAIVNDYLSYPRHMLYFVLSSPSIATLTGLSAPAATDQSQGAFLRILPISALWSADRGVQLFAFLIYSTMLGLIGFLVHVLWRLISHPRDASGNLVNIGLLIAVGSQWPIFALFRPSWVYFVSFMHAYLVIAAYAAARVSPYLQRSSGGLQRAGATALTLLLAIQILAFLSQGLWAPGVGILALRQDRNSSFTTEAGVNVRVNDTERKQYEMVNKLIRANSGPDDRVVCVPYCPGYAFMAGRRMLFKEHYVDNNTPNLRPGWIESAIAATAEKRPAVIVVLDWATNDSEASRFSVWAKRYIEYVEAHYPTVISIPGGTAYVLSEGSGIQKAVDVTGYGPVSTPVGVSFNPQPDGSSALWVAVPGVSAAAQMRFDGKALKSTSANGVVSALLPPEAIAEPGEHWIEVLDLVEGIKTKPVLFKVTANGN